MKKTVDDVLSEIDNYPFYLFVSDSKNITPEIAKLPWSCILTTETNEDKILSLFQTDSRRCRCITTPEDFEKTPIKRSLLSIVFLCGTKTTENISTMEKIGIDKNISRFFAYLPSLLAHFGYLFFDTGKLNSFTISKIEELFFSLRKESISIFNSQSDLKISQELVCEKEIELHSESLNDFFARADLSLYETTSDDELLESRIDFFVNKQRISRDKKRYSDFLDNFYLISEQEINKIQVSSFLTSHFFYQFLQNSAYSYEWYGYANGFNFKRDEDEDLFSSIMAKLKNPNDENNTYLLYGQSGAGKTIAINNIAYKVFKDKEYPVIYLKNTHLDNLRNSDNYLSLSNDKMNASFSLLDEFIRDLENSGSKNVLLIWDLSLPLSIDYENIYFKLSKFLRNRGRNFVLLCSGYSENIRPQRCYQSELRILSSYSSEKIHRFLEYIEKNADFSSAELEAINSFLSSKDDFNLFYIFYRFFYIVKPVITKGIRKEAEVSIESVINQCNKSSVTPEYTLMQLAMMKAGILNSIDANSSYEVRDNDIRQLLIITAICCKFNISVPSDLALRLLDNFDLSLIKSVTNIPFFRFSYDDDGDYSFSIRSQLEANILLQALNVSKEEIISYTCTLIKTADLASSTFKANKEVKCIADLLHRMGPNSNSTQEFEDYYPAIINELKSLHKNNKLIDIRIIVIEINYIREYFSRKEKVHEISSKEFTSQMEYIISLGDSYSAVPDSQKDYNYNMIKIEVANARYVTFNKRYTSDINMLLIAKRDAESVFFTYGDYPYTIWFKTCLELYEEQKSPELLMEMINLIDILRTEYDSIEDDVYMSDLFDRVFSELNGSSFEYIDSLIGSGKSVGVYLKVIKLLRDSDIQIDVLSSFSKEQEDSVRSVITSMQTPEIKDLILSSPECILLLIKLKWLLYNKAPLVLGDKELTKLTKEQWNDLSVLCSKYLQRKEMNNAVSSSVIIEYLQALCYAQTSQYIKANELLQDIKTKGQAYNIQNRVYARHMLCDEKGNILNFTGRLNIAKDGKCRVVISAFNNNNIPLHCKESNLRNLTIEDGKVDNFFQIGIGIMGLSVYHGIKDGRFE